MPFSDSSNANAIAGTKSAAPSIKRVKIGMGIRVTIKNINGAHYDI